MKRPYAKTAVSEPVTASEFFSAAEIKKETVPKAVSFFTTESPSFDKILSYLLKLVNLNKIHLAKSRYLC